MTDSPTPQTRSDGLSAERLAAIKNRWTHVTPEAFGFDSIRRSLCEDVTGLLSHIDHLESSLLSHKQQGRNEGLEEAAKIADKAYALMEKLGKEHTAYDSKDRCFARAREAHQIAIEARALISPLPKAEETKG